MELRNFAGTSDNQIDVSGKVKCCYGLCSFIYRYERWLWLIWTCVEFCNVAPEFKSNAVQHHPTRVPRNIIFKGSILLLTFWRFLYNVDIPCSLLYVPTLPIRAGRKSYIRTPTKLASSVAYPFAFIKPCGFHGDVTLKDINQRIRTPPPSKLKHQPEDPSQSYPTSAFSGKPVVGKTKIHTEGGKGSITIMRTRGWTNHV